MVTLTTGLWELKTIPFNLCKIPKFAGSVYAIYKSKLDVNTDDI